MINPRQKRSVLKAARLYIEMRGHKLLEQGWSAGKHKIDLVVSKDDVIEFIGISYAPEGGITDIAESASYMEKLKLAEEAWIEVNKYSGKYKTYIIEIYGDDYAILSFNEL